MGEPLMGEIKLFGFGWPPRNYAKCDGALLAIEQNQSLYSLLGATYGGDGRTTFGLPDMRGRTPVGTGSGNYTAGYKEGVETVTLNPSQIAGHRHTASGKAKNGNRPVPTSSSCFATSPDAEDSIYGPPNGLVPMIQGMLSATGDSLPHDNMQPYLAINFCIALTGLYPSRN